MPRHLRAVISLAVLFAASTIVPRGACAQEGDQLASYIRLQYAKHEHMVPMRDGTRLTASRVFSDRLSALIA